MASPLEPAPGVLQGFALVVTTMITAAAGIVTARYAMRQKAVETQPDMISREQEARLRAQAQIFEQHQNLIKDIAGQLDRVRQENTDMRADVMGMRVENTELQGRLRICEGKLDVAERELSACAENTEHMKEQIAALQAKVMNS